jgi:hypothetical protein
MAMPVKAIMMAPATENKSSWKPVMISILLEV